MLFETAFAYFVESDLYNSFYIVNNTHIILRISQSNYISFNIRIYSLYDEILFVEDLEDTINYLRSNDKKA